MPPPAVADAAVDQSVELLEVLEAELPAAGAELLEELEAQPAASKTDPTAAAVATIAFDARKVKPSPCRPQGFVGGKRWHLG
jgi:L-lactate utilization protein LutC